MRLSGMQTEMQSGALPEFPAHPAEVGRDAASAPFPLPTLRSNQPSIDLESGTIGTFRSAIYCLPIAVVMWAIIVAAVAHFLIC